jgi:hypothetical protein
MTLKLLARYGEAVTRSMDTTIGDEGTRRAAAGIAASMEREHPGIRDAHARALRALDPTPAANPAQGFSVKDALANAATRFATEFAADLGQEVSRVADEFANDSARRAEPIARGKLRFHRHDCGRGQVCVEIRARASDVLANPDKFARALVAELEGAAASE